MLEALPRVLQRVTAAELSAYYERKHREAGVDIRTGVQVADLEVTGDTVSAVLCADGSRLAADLVVVGIGLLANTELAAARGAFGIPTFFVGEEMFFGKDRLGQVEEELAG